MVKFDHPSNTTVYVSSELGTVRNSEMTNGEYLISVDDAYYGLLCEEIILPIGY
ncbi:MAG: hypothetical protein IPG48_09575 [Saprospiraceae bacterium]|nr:hypothetical protein [Saprospiraceae bacterium]